MLCLNLTADYFHKKAKSTQPQKSADRIFDTSNGLVEILRVKFTRRSYCKKWESGLFFVELSRLVVIVEITLTIHFDFLPCLVRQIFLFLKIGGFDLENGLFQKYMASGSEANLPHPLFFRCAKPYLKELLPRL